MWDPRVLVKPVLHQPGVTRQGRAGPELSVGTNHGSKEQRLLAHYVSSILSIITSEIKGLTLTEAMEAIAT